MEQSSAAEIYDSLTTPILSLPMVGLFLAIVLPAVTFAGLAAGRFVRARKYRQGRLDDIGGGETTLSAILALLGLILAFSFGNALSTYQARKAAILTEASAIGTAFLRADYLQAPSARQLKTALYDYATTRMPGPAPLSNRAETIAFLDRTLEAQSRLWPMTIEATRGEIPAPIQTFVAGAVNEVLDAHLSRVQSFATPVSEVSQMMTLIVALIALCWLGFRDGISSAAIMPRTFVFPAMLWVVMMSIVDTQRGQVGFIRDDYGVLLTTIKEMEIGLRS